MCNALSKIGTLMFIAVIIIIGALSYARADECALKNQIVNVLEETKDPNKEPFIQFKGKMDGEVAVAFKAQIPTAQITEDTLYVFETTRPEGLMLILGTRDGCVVGMGQMSREMFDAILKQMANQQADKS